MARKIATRKSPQGVTFPAIFLPERCLTPSLGAFRAEPQATTFLRLLPHHLPFITFFSLLFLAHGVRSYAQAEKEAK